MPGQTEEQKKEEKEGGGSEWIFSPLSLPKEKKKKMLALFIAKLLAFPRDSGRVTLYVFTYVRTTLRVAEGGNVFNCLRSRSCTVHVHCVTGVP